MVAGLIVVAGGFIYDVEFAGIPYQDPTPAMSERYHHYAHIAAVIRWFGFAVFLFGVMAFILGGRRVR